MTAKKPYTGPERRRWPRPPDSLSKLESIARASGEFSPEDIKQLHLMIEAYKGWQVLGRMAKWLVVFLAGLSGFIIAFGQIKEVLRSWLQS